MECTFFPSVRLDLDEEVDIIRLLKFRQALSPFILCKNELVWSQENGRYAISFI